MPCVLIAILALSLCVGAWAAEQACVLPASFPTTPGYIPIYSDRDKGGCFSQFDQAAFDEMKRIMDGFWRNSDVLFSCANFVQ